MPPARGATARKRTGCSNQCRVRSASGCGGKNRRKSPEATVWHSTRAGFARSPPDAGSRERSSNEFQTPGGKDNHAQQQPAMAPAMDVRLTIRPRSITNRQINQPQIELSRPENQVKIAKGI